MADGAVSDRSIRVVAVIDSPQAGIAELRAKGWEVDDLGLDELIPARWFASLQEAREAAERDFPAETAVTWSERPAGRVGGFIVGRSDVHPPVGDDLVPTFVLWPDGGEQRVETRAELVQLLRGRMDWLFDLARAEGLDEDELQAARGRVDAALASLEAGGPIGPDCQGPRADVRFAAKMRSVASVRWDGFRTGWMHPEVPPGAQEHPVESRYRGEFRGTWRAGVRDGIAARRAPA